MGRIRKNDQERELWVLNDEGLYNWQRSSKMSMRKFIREHRKEIDDIITNAVTKKTRVFHNVL